MWKTLLILGLTSSGVALAKVNPVGKECTPLRKSCEKAGYTKAPKKGAKGRIAECVKKVTDGKKVAGVKVTPKQIESCKGKKAAKVASRKAAKKTGKPHRKSAKAPAAPSSSKADMSEPPPTADPAIDAAVADTEQVFLDAPADGSGTGSADASSTEIPPSEPIDAGELPPE